MGFESIFGETKLDLSNITCHSGGALGADMFWETDGIKYGVKTMAYSYKTKYHNSPNKIEISEEDYIEGIEEVNKANRHMNRFGINKYMNLLARNWAQVKYSDQLFAIGKIIEPGGRTLKGYYSKSKYQTVDGGTSWAVAMSINHHKDVFVFDQYSSKWFRWSYDTMSFLEMLETPKISCQNFAGIGTRNLTDDGRQAISDVYKKTFGSI